MNWWDDVCEGISAVADVLCEGVNRVGEVIDENPAVVELAVTAVTLVATIVTAQKAGRLPNRR